jgi:histidyl-tRNA synthetase
VGEIEPRLFKGTRDFLPDMMIRKQYMTDRLRAVFERYGFEPVETPAMEFYDILVGKYGGESEKLIYPLAYRDGKTLALRYDLTVPLARLVAMNPELPMPFKRYQIQPVWRADNPQLRQGRFREFVQCDVDTVGAASVLADAEIMAMIDTCLMELGVRDFVLKVNNRKILFALAAYLGLSEDKGAEIIRIMDKRDKVGLEGVEKELALAGFAPRAMHVIARITEIKGSNADKISAIAEALEDQPLAKEGAEELRVIFASLAGQGIDEARCVFDPALARGLDYYTGPIFEAVLPSQPHIGSLCGGGRYDKLIGRYAGRDIPATGTTIGLDRIIAAMEQLNLLPSGGTKVDALVCLFDEASVAVTQKAASVLRKDRLNIDTYFEPGKLKKQFAYADKRGIPVVVVIGPDEAAANKATVKNMKTGEQQLVPFEELPQAVRKLARPT